MRSARVLIVAAIASILLESCSPTTQSLASGPTITATPTLSINDALTNAACTSTSCIALSTSQFGSGEQYSESSRTWTPLHLPATALQVSASSCWATGCLIAGSTGTSQFLWKYSSGYVSALQSPTSFQTIQSINCFAASTCTVIGFNPSSSSLEMLYSHDAGATWTSPATLPTALSVTGKISLSCDEANNCLVSGSSRSGSSALLFATHDAGVTWLQRTINPSWSTIHSLSCSALKCISAMTDSTGNSFVLRTNTYGRIWKKVSSSNSAVTAMSCANLSTCVVVGTNKTSGPWLETWQNGVLVVNKLNYVTTPFNDVACLPTKCVVVGNTNVATVPFSS